MSNDVVVTAGNHEDTLDTAKLEMIDDEDAEEKDHEKTLADNDIMTSAAEKMHHDVREAEDTIVHQDKNERMEPSLGCGDMESMVTMDADSANSSMTKRERARECDPHGMIDLEASGTSVPKLSLTSFGGSLFQLIEELKYFRTVYSDAEERLMQMRADKQVLEKALEETTATLKSNTSHQEERDKDVRRQHDDQVQAVEAEKEKTASQCRYFQKQLEAVKEELRATQLLNYELEKKLSDQACQVHQDQTAKNNIRTRVASLEQKATGLAKQAQDASSILEQLKENMQTVEKRQDRLMCVNRQESNRLSKAQKDLAKAIEETAELRAKCAAIASNSSASSLQSSKLAADHRKEASLRKQIEDQLEESHRESKRLVALLAESHKLVERHQERAEKEQCTSAEVVTKLTTAEASNAELERLQAQAQQSTKELEDKLRTIEKTKQDLQTRLDNMLDQYNDLHYNCKKMEVSRKSAEQLEKKLRNKVEELEGQITLAKENQAALFTKAHEQQARIACQEANIETQKNTSHQEQHKRIEEQTPLEERNTMISAEQCGGKETISNPAQHEDMVTSNANTSKQEMEQHHQHLHDPKLTSTTSCVSTQQPMPATKAATCNSEVPPKTTEPREVRREQAIPKSIQEYNGTAVSGSPDAPAVTRDIFHDTQTPTEAATDKDACNDDFIEATPPTTASQCTADHQPHTLPNQTNAPVCPLPDVSIALHGTNRLPRLLHNAPQMTKCTPHSTPTTKPYHQINGKTTEILCLAASAATAERTTCVRSPNNTSSEVRDRDKDRQPTQEESTEESQADTIAECGRDTRPAGTKHGVTTHALVPEESRNQAEIPGKKKDSGTRLAPFEQSSTAALPTEDVKGTETSGYSVKQSATDVEDTLLTFSDDSQGKESTDVSQCLKLLLTKSPTKRSLKRKHTVSEHEP